MYTDRTHGGKPTPCAAGVDLDDLRVSEDYAVEYKGAEPTEIETIGGGTFGVVHRLTYADGAAVMLKQQDVTDAALANLRAAEALKECDLVDFRSVNVEDLQIWTMMEALEKACNQMSMSRRRRDADRFAAFMERTLACLVEHQASFSDMKLGNVAVRACAVDRFRLIDLDGINSSISTFPGVAAWATGCWEAEDRRVQTEYAFGVTAMLFELPQSASAPFLWATLAPLSTRRRLLDEHAEQTSTPGVARLIRAIDYSKFPS